MKCPACGFSADSRIFRDGCPVCGYALTASTKTADEKSVAKKKADQIDPLPLWIYLVSFLLLTGLIVLILLQR